jgi:3-hydroxyisobutyrate dehydrogenase-like beta-hydroxyacid dehydrogenase
MERIGFIGVGKMGRPMALNLAAKGYNVQAYDIRPEAAQELEGTPIIYAQSLHQLAQNSDIIITMVFSGEQVQQILVGPDGILPLLALDTVILEMTSSNPAITLELGKQCAEKNIHLIDAPVSGGVESAEKGTLTVMVGGEEDLVNRVKPVLMSMAKKIIHVGPQGSGHAMKVMNNFISATTLAATTEVVAVARKAGIPAERVIEVLQTSTGTSDAATRKFPRHILPDQEIGFTIGIMHKDVKTYLQFAERIGIPTFVSSAIYQIWNLHMIEGRGQKDAIHFVEPFERWCGSIIRGLSKDEKSS